MLDLTLERSAPQTIAQFDPEKLMSRRIVTGAIVLVVRQVRAQVVAASGRLA
jgi:hypothetical protein